MASNKDVATDLSPVIRVYEDSTVERLIGSPYVAPSPEDPTTGVSSKDITISPTISARLYLPKLPSSKTTTQKLPILIYFHGGGFCLESAFSSIHHTYLNSLVSQANALAVSVEYRLAPEHPLPAAYEDCWAAIQWVALHHFCSNNSEPWLNNFGDFDKIYIGGDSSGGNIVHNMAMRAGVERLYGDVKIMGGFLTNPYFLGSKPVGSSEPRENHDQSLIYRIWRLVYPSAPGGIDNVMINPFAGDAPSLSGLGCCRLLVVVTEKDVGRDRSVKYYESVKESEWEGEVELIYVEGEGHSFHVINPQGEKARSLISRLAAFIN